ncbi:MAG: lysoplasmalogenase [Oscillospiraceae bacterium]|nr:lysoplasmalogenase [Oscillospiraceae bacterium]
MVLEKIASVLCVVGMIVFVPLFLKAAWPEKTNKSLAIKMLCASFFVLFAALQMRIADNYSGFAVRMFWGFVASWVGDLFMHLRLKQKALAYALGVVSFFGAHVLFISGYAIAGRELLGISLFNMPETLLFALVFVCLIAFLLIKKFIKFTSFLPLLLVYGLAVFFMMVKATGLGARLFIDGQQPWFVFALLALGGICFATSDATLLLIDFAQPRHGKERPFHTKPLKAVNIWTYFIGQLLLACSIAFLRA